MDIEQNLKDTAYIAVGLGVLGFQRAQVARVELQRNLSSTLDSALTRAPSVTAPDVGSVEAGMKAQVEDVKTVVEAQLTEVKAQVQKLVGQVEEALEPLTKQLEERLDEVEAHLPEQVKAAVQQARSAAEQVRSLLVA